MARMGKYELLELVGRGGMGEVWKARDSSLGRVVALKLLTKTDEELVARFQREGRVVAKLNHPNVAQLFEVGSDPPHIAMQFVEGAPLDVSPLSLPQKVAALRDAARAVHYAHGQQVLHRDVKPANILVDGQGRAFVVDFGMARDIRTIGRGLTVTGDILGTPSFMAPEQALGDPRAIDARTDVYGLGATLYTLLNHGRPPFNGPSPYDIVRQVVEDDPSPSEGPWELGTIAHKALEKDRARRYASAADFAEDLDRWLKGESISAAAPSMWYRLGKRIRRRPAVWALATVLVVALAAGGWFGMSQVLRRGREAEARAKVERAAASLEGVRAALYIEGGGLGPSLPAIRRARTECEAVLRDVPDFGPALYWIGRSHLLEGDFEKAVAWLTRATAAEPESGHFWAALGRAHLEQALGQNMRRDHEKSRRLSWLRDGAARAQVCYRRAGGAATLLDRAIAEASRLAAGTDAAPLRKVIQDAIATQGSQPGIEILHLWLGAMESDDPTALRHFTDAIRICPGGVHGYVNRGCVHLSMGDVPSALADFNEAVRVNPVSPEAFFSRGYVRDKQSDFAGAIDDYSQAIRLDPGFVEAYCNRANRRWLSGDEAGGMRDIDRALAISPRSPFALANRGEMRSSRGDLKGALADLDLALAVDRDHPTARYTRATVHLDLHDYPSAEKDFTEVLAVDPRDGETLYGRARARMQMKKWSGARDDLIEALQLMPAAWPRRDEVVKLLETIQIDHWEDF